MTRFLPILLLSALTAGAANMKVAWNSMDDSYVTAFRVYAGTNQPPTWTNALRVFNAGMATSAVLTNVWTGCDGWVFVTASAGQWESDASQAVTFHVPNPPSGVTVQGVNVLAWLESAECIEGPYSVMALLAEHRITTEPTAQFFRLRGSIEKEP